MSVEKFATDCELVLALVAPIGVNLDDVRNKLTSFFNQFDYKVNFIHLSKLAKAFSSQQTVSEKEAERLDQGMNIGNSLREKYKRGDFLILVAIAEMLSKRPTEQDKSGPLKRTVHIIRSLKHPDEVETLRQVYGPGFFLLGISSSNKNRKKYLKDEKGVPDSELDRLIERDDKEKGSFGQSTRDVFQMADAFLTADSSEALSDQISRIADLLFGKPIISPTKDEYAMFLAYAASLRSADLSRQVGAVIVSKDGDIIATGANDVPRFGGGLYWPSSDDQRDYVLGYDFNEKQRNEIIMKIMKKFYASNDKKDDDLLKEGKQLLKETGIFDITEYGRAVHAEMEALLSCARSGLSVREAILYTTTFPCHNCAKHIVAAGITKVKYIEPYPKSYATILHNDSIETESQQSKKSGKQNKVVFEPFVGVGPRRFIDLFSLSLSSGRKIKRKIDGNVVSWERSGAELRVPLSPLSYIESEMALVNELDDIAGS